MAAYFQRDRFAPLDEQVMEVPSRGYMPQTHERQFGKLNVRAIDPSLMQTVAERGPSLLQMAIDAANWYVDLRKNERYGDIANTISAQLPSGRQYTLVVLNVGGWGGTEDISIYAKGADPDMLVAASTEFDRRTITGANTTIDEARVVFTSDPLGNLKEISVGPDRQSSVDAPLQRERNFIDREPHGFERGGARELPADARFDRGYPGNDRMNA